MIIYLKKFTHFTQYKNIVQLYIIIIILLKYKKKILYIFLYDIIFYKFLFHYNIYINIFYIISFLDNDICFKKIDIYIHEL